MSRIDYTKPLIMGILNVTPDSFSDGGDHVTPAAALEHAIGMLDQGADIIDIGGESTRPGSQAVSVAEQIRRVENVIEPLHRHAPDCLISIDTRSSEVAQVALRAGAGIINDVSAGLDDPAMLGLAAAHRIPIVLMHRKGTSATMQDDPHYDDVVAEVREFLESRAEAALTAGVASDRIILDPGIGFGKLKSHNLELLADLDQLSTGGYPVLLGVSRKRFMGSICATGNPRELVAATCAVSALGVMSGASIFRVHDVKENRQAVDVAWAIKGER